MYQPSVVVHQPFSFQGVRQAPRAATRNSKLATSDRTWNIEYRRTNPHPSLPTSPSHTYTHTNSIPLDFWSISIDSTTSLGSLCVHRPCQGYTHNRTGLPVNTCTSLVITVHWRAQSPTLPRWKDEDEVPASDSPGQQRGKRQARLGEEETLQPPRTQPWQDLEWKQTLQVAPGLNNLNTTCLCNAVLQCLTHTAPLPTSALITAIQAAQQCSCKCGIQCLLGCRKTRHRGVWLPPELDSTNLYCGKLNKDGISFCCQCSKRCTRIPAIFNSQHAPRWPEGGRKPSPPQLGAHRHVAPHFRWIPAQSGALRLVPHQHHQVRHHSGFVT